MVSFPTTSSNL